MKAGPASTALVSDAGRGSAISVIRSLGQRGWRVVAASSERIVPGFYSRWTSVRLRHARPREDPDGAVDALLEALGQYQVSLLVPVTDEIILPMLSRRSELEARCTLALPATAPYLAMRDKWATIELARRLGVPVPRSVLVTDQASAVAGAEQLGWPVVVKPRYSYRYDAGQGCAAHVAYAHDHQSLLTHVATMPPEGVVLQEQVKGEGRGVGLLLHDGTPLAAFGHRRLREVPWTGGASAYRESIALEEPLYRAAVLLLAELRWTGLAMAEFKVGPTGPVLMEVNGRIWGSLPLAVMGGVDFPGLLADLLTRGQRPVGLLGDYRHGVRSRDLELERLWISSVLGGRRRPGSPPPPPRRDAFLAAARLLSPNDGYDVARLDDPVPGMVELARVAATATSSLVRTVGAKHLGPR